jgi:hypothetical protein
MTPQDTLDAVVDAILADDTAKLDRLLGAHGAMPEMRELARAVREVRLLLHDRVSAAGRARHLRMINNALTPHGTTGAVSPPRIGL